MTKYLLRRFTNYGSHYHKTQIEGKQMLITKKTYFASTLVCFMMLASSTSYAANTAPTTSPSGETNAIIDSSGKTIDVTASGGDCDQPNQSCKWTKDGSLVYVWSYTGLQGTPTSGSEGTTLKIKCDQSGSSNVTVKATQKWKEPGGNTGTTMSTASSAVKAKVQKPTSISFVSSSASSDGSGGEYTFTVKDQDGDPIKNAKLTLTETIEGNQNISNLNGLTLNTITYKKQSGNASSKGTDGNGKIIDHAGNTINYLNSMVNLANQSIITTIKVTHTYDDIVTSDGKKYSVTLQQNQIIVQKAILNSDRSITTTTVSVTP